MEPFTVLGIAVGLAMDAFAVSLAASVSLGMISRRHVFRFAFHFGLFQAMMPVLGWLLGSAIAPHIRDWDHWVAFLLLTIIGGKATWEAIRGAQASEGRGDPTRGWSLVGLSLATSMDAFVVGLSFAMLNVTILYPAVVIGLVTATLTCAGMMIGGRLGAQFGRRMEIAGGLILIGIGLKILLADLLCSA